MSENPRGLLPDVCIRWIGDDPPDPRVANRRPRERVGFRRRTGRDVGLQALRDRRRGCCAGTPVPHAPARQTPLRSPRDSRPPIHTSHCRRKDRRSAGPQPPETPTVRANSTPTEEPRRRGSIVARGGSFKRYESRLAAGAPNAPPGASRNWGLQPVTAEVTGLAGRSPALQISAAGSQTERQGPYAPCSRSRQTPPTPVSEESRRNPRGAPLPQARATPAARKHPQKSLPRREAVSRWWTIQDSNL